MIHRAERARTIQPRTIQLVLALFAGTAATVIVLVATRPTLAQAPASWSGDDLAVAILWWGAVIASVWLAITTLACVAALARGRTRSAHRVARFAPPLARRVLQTALISTWALVPAAAYAAPATAPITVHVDARGRLTTDARRATRAPAPTTTPRSKAVHPSTTTATTTTTTTTTTTSPVVSHRDDPRPLVARIKLANVKPATTPARSPTAPVAPSVAPSVGARIHIVVAGDNLWQIARTEVARASGSGRVTDSQIAPYWQKIITANRDTLRSSDPSLIFPGEVVALP